MSTTRPRASRVFTISFPEDLAQQVEQVAQEESRNISELFREAFRTYRLQRAHRTLDKLRAGVPPQTMLTASALAVTRSSDLPPGHHGGPLHPLAGLYSVSKLVGRLQGEQRFLPVLQHVALANKHIHDPVTSPYSLLEFTPAASRPPKRLS